MTEQWREIAGYEGIYSVSDQGRVRRDLGGGCTHKGRIVSCKAKAGRYPQVGLSKDGTVTVYRVHHLVATAFLGPCPDFCDGVNHKNGGKSDNRADNLEWSSHADNTRHAAEVLDAFGTLKSKKVAILRHMYASGKYTVAELAEWFGVNPSSIGNAVHGDTYQYARMDNVKPAGWRGGKLTREKVSTIRKHHRAGQSMTAIARDFGVSLSNVSLIINRKRWANVP